MEESIQYHKQLDTAKIKLLRGQRGTYGWEISVYGSDIDEILHEISKADALMRGDYSGGP